MEISSSNKKIQGTHGIEWFQKTIHVGQEGASEFTKLKDPERAYNYIRLHSKCAYWWTSGVDTAVCMSMCIWWEQITLTCAVGNANDIPCAEALNGQKLNAGAPRGWQNTPSAPVRLNVCNPNSQHSACRPAAWRLHPAEASSTVLGQPTTVAAQLPHAIANPVGKKTPRAAPERGQTLHQCHASL